MPVALKPYAGVDALYAPRRTVLDALLVDAAEEAGARFRFGLAVTDLARDGAGRVVGVVLRDHGGATWTETRTARHRRRRTRLGGGRSGGRADRRGRRPRRGVRLRVLARRGPRRLPLVLRRRAVRRRHPDQRRPRLRVRRRPAGRARRGDAPPPPARCGSASCWRGSTEGSPTSPAAPPVGPVRVFRGMPARLRRPYGPGWALVGRRRLVEGPAVHPRDHRRPARRGAARRRRRRRGGVGPRGRARAGRLPGASGTGSALPMHPIVDRLASHEWDLAEARRLLRGLSSVMADEVDAILGLDPAPARTA